MCLLGSVIAFLGENRVLKVKSDLLPKTKSREEEGMVPVLTSSGIICTLIQG